MWSSVKEVVFEYGGVVLAAPAVLFVLWQSWRRRGAVVLREFDSYALGLQSELLRQQLNRDTVTAMLSAGTRTHHGLLDKTDDGLAHGKPVPETQVTTKELASLIRLSEQVAGPYGVVVQWLARAIWPQQVFGVRLENQSAGRFRATVWRKAGRRQSENLAFVDVELRKDRVVSVEPVPGCWTSLAEPPTPTACVAAIIASALTSRRTTTEAWLGLLHVTRGLFAYYPVPDLEAAASEFEVAARLDPTRADARYNGAVCRYLMFSEQDNLAARDAFAELAAREGSPYFTALSWIGVARAGGQMHHRWNAAEAPPRDELLAIAQRALDILSTDGRRWVRRRQLNVEINAFATQAFVYHADDESEPALRAAVVMYERAYRLSTHGTSSERPLEAILENNYGYALMKLAERIGPDGPEFANMLDRALRLLLEALGQANAPIKRHRFSWANVGNALRLRGDFSLALRAYELSLFPEAYNPGIADPDALLSYLGERPASDPATVLRRLQEASSTYLEGCFEYGRVLYDMKDPLADDFFKYVMDRAGTVELQEKFLRLMPTSRRAS